MLLRKRKEKLMARGRPVQPINLSGDDKLQLQSVARSRSLPHGLVRRAKIILMAAEGLNGICQDIVDPSLKSNYAKTSFTFGSKNRYPPKGSRNQRRQSIHHPERVQASEERCLSQL